MIFTIKNNKSTLFIKENLNNIPHFNVITDLIYNFKKIQIYIDTMRRNSVRLLHKHMAISNNRPMW